jgi:hypothetical protein
MSHTKPSSPTPTDAVALVENLDPDAIAKRLDELVAEERALRVLLHSARARQQAQRRRQQKEAKADAS